MVAAVTLLRIEEMCGFQNYNEPFKELIEIKAIFSISGCLPILLLIFRS